MDNTQLFRAATDHCGFAPGNNCDLNALVGQQLNARPIANMEMFGFNAGVTVNDSSICENAVHVKNNALNSFGDLIYGHNLGLLNQK
jgi:hypothetical protein